MFVNYINELLKAIKINSSTTIDTFKIAIFDPNSDYVKGLIELNRIISYKQQTS